MIIGFTGSQNGMTQRQKESLFYLFTWYFQISHGCLQLRHGDCVGADSSAHNIFQALPLAQPIDVLIHPPVDDKKRSFRDGHIVTKPLPYLQRNKYIAGCIAGFNTDLLIAAPSTDHEIIRSGTWATVRYARSCGTLRIILLP